MKIPLRFFALAAYLAACTPAPEPVVAQPSLSASAPSVSSSSDARAPATAAAAPLPAPTDVRLPKGVTPKEYALDLRVDPRKERFEGAVKIRVTLDKASRSIVMHARDVTIARASAVIGAERAPATWTTRPAKGGREADEELVLQFERDLPPGELSLEIDYSAPFAKLRGLYRVKVGDAWYAFTQLEPVDARRVFPGFDEPRFKTPFSLSVSVPKGMKAFANSALAKAEPDGESARHVFEKTLPLPTYLIAIAVGDLDVLEGPQSPTPIRLIATAGKAKAGKSATLAAADFLKIFGEYFDRPYPYGKLDIVAVPDFVIGAMENPGLVTFREEAVLVDGDAASMPMRRRMEGTMAHELAHQWFGDLVTMEWWDDLWLNEGFATWMGSKACDKWRPGFGAMLDLTSERLKAMNADMLPSSRPVRVPVETSSAIREAGGWSAYQKGGSVLAMLERWVGEAPLRDGLRAYLKAHEFGTVTSDDLLRALDASTGKPVSKVAKSFIDQPGVPVVTFDWIDASKGPKGANAPKSAGASLGLSQAPLRALSGAGGQTEPTWTIPVCASPGKGPALCALLDGNSGELALPKAAPIYPNELESGYYRFDSKDIVALTARKDLAETERLGLLSNAWGLAQAGRLDAGRLFTILDRAALGAETSRVVMDQAVSILFGARDALIDDKHAPAFRAAVSRWLGPQAKRLGWASKKGEPDDARILRLTALGALWDLADDADVAKGAEPIAAAYLKDPKSADRDLGPLALRISAYAGGAATADALKQRLASASPFDRTVIIGALASLRDPAALRATFEMLVSGEIRGGDIRYVWSAAARRPGSREVFSTFLRERFTELRGKLASVAGFPSTIAWQCTEEGRARAVAFFEPKLASVEGMQRSFDEGVAQSRLCSQVRSKELANAGAWLDAHK